jgi:predicted RNase H-like HicB family nuclease
MSTNSQQNGASRHWVRVHAEPAGVYTAQAVGLPEVRAAGATREEALSRLHQMLHILVSSGALVELGVPMDQPHSSAPHWDPNDPEMLAFMQILDQQSREDLERTLQELDQECSNSSSTPTT